MVRLQTGGVQIELRYDLFFDRKKIDKALDGGTKRAMSKGLRFIQVRARGSLRRQKKTSLPGQPPRVHTSNPYKTLKNILFYYDPNVKTGVVGPVGIGATTRLIKATKPVPATMEFGGTIAFRKGAIVGGGSTGKKKAALRDASGRFVKRSSRTGYYIVTTAFSKRVRARQFMLPALEKEVQLGNILKSWHGQIHE